MLNVVSIRSRQLDIETGTFKPAAEQRSELGLRRGFCGFGSGWLDWQSRKVPSRVTRGTLLFFTGQAEIRSVLPIDVPGDEASEY